VLVAPKIESIVASGRAAPKPRLEPTAHPSTAKVKARHRKTLDALENMRWFSVIEDRDALDPCNEQPPIRERCQSTSSPPFRVPSPRHTAVEIDSATNRVDPSPIKTLTPPGCKLLAVAIPVAVNIDP
jgi:hypothetical protein